MPVQMIELEEMQMIEVSDDGLEASIGGHCGIRSTQLPPYVGLTCQYF